MAHLPTNSFLPESDLATPYTILRSQYWGKIIENFSYMVLLTLLDKKLNTSMQLPAYQQKHESIWLYSCHVNINNLPYSDRYSYTDKQIEMF